MRKLLTYTAAIFSSLFGGQAVADQFISERQFKRNMSHQIAMTPQTLDQLYKYGVTQDSELKLEYFFYTNREDKATSLNSALSEKGYTTEYGQSAGDKKLFIVTGWTTPIKMDTLSAKTWTEEMCRIGYEHDAEFDGWGTNPSQ